MTQHALKILIADDEEALRLSMAGILELEGHNVMTAPDGRSAVELVRNNSFDVAFLDIRMPGMNGVDAFKIIKSISPETTVIMMTAYAVNDLLIEAANEGAYACILKPFDMDTVINTVKEVSRKPLIMVIDDDQPLCNLLNERFKEHGFNVVTRPSGLEGVQLLRRKVPDMVFLDMVMEDMDGLTTLQRMKEILGDQCPKIVMMSAYDVKDKFDTARRLGALECVKKPLDFALLKETIYRALAEGDRPHICIVDDDRFTCTVVKKVLADNGYEVEIANSGGEVMRMLGKDAFSVAIINAGTTGVNAIDVYEKIRLQNRDIGVIIVSNTAFDENTFNALQKSNYSFLQKPFDAEQILRMVQNIQNRKKEK